jgi:hypothetical protein
MVRPSSLVPSLIFLVACAAGPGPAVELPPSASTLDASAQDASAEPPPEASAADATSSSVTMTTVDASATVDAGPPTCPAAYGGAVACGPGTFALRCTYPQGVCYCGSPPQCGGAYRPPMPPSWTCEAPRPTCARAGTACKKAGETCFSGVCHYGSVVVCENGVWVARMVPPPP